MPNPQVNFHQFVGPPKLEGENGLDEINEWEAFTVNMEAV